LNSDFNDLIDGQLALYLNLKSAFIEFNDVIRSDEAIKRMKATKQKTKKRKAKIVRDQ